jgi:orotidine-5'-phosphate decarboxylase
MTQITQQSFREKWLKAVDEKGSVLCAGLDPAEFEMGRGEKGLPKNVIKRDWAMRYIEAVASCCAALKYNIQYWKKEAGADSKRVSDLDALVEIRQVAHARGMVVIEDSKLVDIGSTNDAGVYYAKDKLMDAVTFSPFPGNMQEAATQARNRKLGLISMCLMSNPEYEREKNKLVPFTREELASWPNFLATEVVTREKKDGTFQYYIPQYLQLAHDASKFEVDGIVIGAPSKDNHIEDQEIYNVSSCVNNLNTKMLVLVPGVGYQGGEAGKMWKYFKENNVIVNVGRDLMLPEGSDSTPEQQAAAAIYYRDMLNELRATA